MVLRVALLVTEALEEFVVQRLTPDVSYCASL